MPSASSSSSCPLPLAGWRFGGSLRTYQAEVLERLSAGGVGPLHIVAPPGSGKTLLGLLLAAREGHGALILAPTVTIRHQWARQATELSKEPAAVSFNPERIADLTTLTYQALSVTGVGSPFSELARSLWVEELVAAGRTDADAESWLAELAVLNRDVYNTGIRRRTRRLRSTFARRNPAQLKRVLHPRAVALIDRIVAAGVRTIVLDECHHLLDHWALVVAYLAGRIRENGVEPLLIGLTATLPSPDDETEYDNYTQLLGDVDYEVPTPAVVKEGHLAPYREHLLLTEPTPLETAFLRRHQELLRGALVEVLSTDDGIAYLEEQLQPKNTEDNDAAGPLASIDAAFAASFSLARSCAVVLRELVPSHPLVALIPPVLLDRCTTDDLLTVLGRFAQSRLLLDPTARDQWEFVRRLLSDFGYILTDHGIRRGRNPVETTLASSASKDAGAVEILRRELAGTDGERVRAVIVTDYVMHGNGQGDDTPAGALRTFERLTEDPAVAAMRPVLLTRQHVRVRLLDAPSIQTALSAVLSAPVQIGEVAGLSCELRVPTPSRDRIVAAVSELVRRGTIRLIVGTRGLLGEGWDCPAINTLIDLTTTATAPATQQLRGRTLRLDPDWPEKVAHNWSVACLIPADIELDSGSEANRLRRKHSHLWGPSANRDGQIVKGLGHLIPIEAASAMARVLGKEQNATIQEVNALLHAARPSRGSTRDEWRIGEPYRGAEHDQVTVRRARRTAFMLCAPFTPRAHALALAGAASLGITFEVLSANGLVTDDPVIGLTAVTAGGALAIGVPMILQLLRALRLRHHPAILYRTAALVVARTLRDAGRIAPFDEPLITATVPHANGDCVRIEVGDSGADRAVIADAVEELFSPVRSPRFLIQTGRGGRTPGTWFERLADRLSPGRTLLPVPHLIARRRTDAELFRARWAQAIGPCRLHELKGAQGLALLRVARSLESHLDPADSRTRVWG